MRDQYQTRIGKRGCVGDDLLRAVATASADLLRVVAAAIAIALHVALLLEAMSSNFEAGDQGL